VSQQSVGPNLTEYQYSFVLTNTGAAVAEVQAALVATPQNVNVVNDILLFGNIAANSMTTSYTFLTIQRDPSSSFDPSTLQWNVTATGPVINVNLIDSGTFDAATGDGVYTGTFTPTSPGTYTAALSATGTSLAGNSFSRSAITEFTLTPQQLASFTSFTDSQQSSGVTVTATVNVQTAGPYRFTMQLQASNQIVLQGGATVTLSAGSQQIPVIFSNSQLFGLGVNGPYERVNALLVDVGSSGDLIADSRADAGPTAAYTLSSFAPAVYFTGTNSAAGVVVGTGHTTFDLLRVTSGVFSSSATSCGWNAVLTDLSGNQIAYSSSGGSLTAGANLVTLDFNGNLIAQAVNGPYLVKDAAVHCRSAQANAAILFQTQSFTASQFTFVSPDFSMSVTSTPPSAAAGSTFSFGIFASAAGGFSGAINLGVTGLPTGASAVFNVPTLVGFGPSYMKVSTSASTTPAGSYPLTITGTSGTFSHSVNATLTVTAGSGGNGYSFHRTVTIAHTKVPNTDQTNFPVLFNRTDALLKTVANGGHVQNANGYDIIFTSDAAGTVKLDHEIEYYNATTGQFVAWLRVPTLSHTADTVIYQFYGNSSITTSQENKTGVWNSNYKGVWHMAENAANTTVKDSTSNANNGTDSVNTATMATTGQIDGALLFQNASAQHIVLTTNDTLHVSSSFTFEAWVKLNSTPSPAAYGILSCANSNPDGGYNYAFMINNNRDIQYRDRNSSSGWGLNYAFAVPLSTWTFVTATFDGTNIRFYQNGTSSTTAAATLGDSTPGNCCIGGLNVSSNSYFDGTLDEIRLSNIARSADWITAEYNNQNSPATFYTLSGE
jgi:hypothetical protein